MPLAFTHEDFLVMNLIDSDVQWVIRKTLLQVCDLFGRGVNLSNKNRFYCLHRNHVFIDLSLVDGDVFSCMESID